MIPDDKIAEIRERSDLVSIAGEYVTLKKAGLNHKGVCPFHADSDPSFNVNGVRQFYHCFGCGASGDVFSFVQRIEGLSFMEAARQLAAKSGVTLPEKPMTPVQKSERDRAREARERRYQILELATVYFEQQLAQATGAPGRSVLAERQVGDETAGRFRIGFALDQWDGLLRTLAAQGISGAEAEAVGLALPRKTGSGYYDRFRNRLVFTICDGQGRPVAFSARAMPGDDSNAKYINSPETREYTKGKTLFGLHQARVGMSKSRTAVLVEGNFDVVAMHNAGFDNVVAPLGTAFTAEQALLLRRRVDQVIIMFDGDRAGIAAATKAFPLLAKTGLAAYMVTLDGGDDPDSFLRDKGRDAMAALLEKKVGLLDNIIRLTAEASDGSAQDVARKVKWLGPLLGALSSSMERELYKQKVATAFGVEPTLIFRFLRGGPVEQSARGGRPDIARPLPGSADERELVGLLLDLPVLAEEAVARGGLEMMRTEPLALLASKLVENSRHHSSSSAALMAGDDNDPVITWFAQRGMERLFDDEERGKVALKEIIEQLKKRTIEEQIAEIAGQIRTAHQTGDDMMVLALMRKKTELLQEVHGVGANFDNEVVRH